MPIILEIVIYLLLILSIMFVTWLYIAYDNKNIIENYNFNIGYIRNKNKDIKVKMIVNIEGVSEEQAEEIGQMIAYGKFDNIYDIVDKYVVLLKENKYEKSQE